jgi:hypothetical protein
MTARGLPAVDAMPMLTADQLLLACKEGHQVSPMRAVTAYLSHPGPCCSIKKLEEVVRQARIKPAVNQVGARTRQPICSGTCYLALIADAVPAGHSRYAHPHF